MVDLVIRGGRIVDGTGAPERTGDVAIDKGRIVAVGEIADTGAREIDADGLVVAPGATVVRSLLSTGLPPAVVAFEAVNRSAQS